MSADRPGRPEAAGSASIQIGDRRIGPGAPTYIVAEMSANHGQDFERAVAIVRAAREAGADAVKLQTYTPDTLTIDCNNEHFLIGKGTMWEGRTLYDLYREAFTPWEWQPRLKDIADDIGLDLFSSPFDSTAVDFLERMGVPAYKIASFELVDLDLVRRVARTGKPIILSTGMAMIEEIREAIDAARAAGAAEIALLKCTSAYPAPPEEINLCTLADLAATFGVPVGLSDHTLGIAVPVAAVALGACFIEKHFTLSRDVASTDGAFSLEPAEFRAMVEAIRTVEKALGSVHYGASTEEAKSRVFRRSLFIVRDMKAGEVFSRENIRSIRPGFGLAPKHFEEIEGRRAAVDLPRGTPLRWDHVEVVSPSDRRQPLGDHRDV
jgi:N-acetylneuraminate synthase